MSTRWMFGALLGLCCLARVELAHAGCPSTCQGTVGAVTVDPELSCALIDTSLGTCDCAVSVRIQNTCPGTLEVRSDEVRCTGRPDCFALQAGESGTFEVPIRSTGSKEWSLPLQEGESGAHTLDIRVSVTEYDGEPGC